MPNLTLDEIRDTVEVLVRKVFEPAGMELIELKVAGHKNDVQIQITADKSSGGITIRECAILNKSLVAAIEQEGVLPPEIFSLELSSPGLDRPLITRKDFIRSTGKELCFWLNEKIEGKKEVQGILVEVSDSAVTIITDKRVKLVLPLNLIIKGMLVF